MWLLIGAPVHIQVGTEVVTGDEKHAAVTAAVMDLGETGGADIAAAVMVLGESGGPAPKSHPTTVVLFEILLL